MVLVYLLTPDIVALTGAASHVLVAQEALEVDVVAEVLARLAVGAAGSRSRLIAVQVEITFGDLLLTQGSLAAADDRHGHGARRVGCAEVILIVHRSVDLLCHRGGSQGGDKERSKAGLHLDRVDNTEEGLRDDRESHKRNLFQ